MEGMIWEPAYVMIMMGQKVTNILDIDWKQYGDKSPGIGQGDPGAD